MGYFETLEVLEQDEVLSKMFDVCEREGWCLDASEQGNEYLIELSQYSPLGEDFGFSVFISDPNKSGEFAKELCSYANLFDADEHASMWIEAKFSDRAKQLGIADFSVLQLAHDAEAIKRMLSDLGRELRTF